MKATLEYYFMKCKSSSRFVSLTCHPCCGCWAESSAVELPASCSLSSHPDSWWRPWGCSRHPSGRTSRLSCPGDKEVPYQNISAPELVGLRCPDLGSLSENLVTYRGARTHLRWRWCLTCSWPPGICGAHWSQGSKIELLLEASSTLSLSLSLSQCFLVKSFF